MNPPIATILAAPVPWALARARPCRSALAVLAVLAAGRPVAAQVGHAPEDSPYRDIRYSSFLVLSGGRVLGAGGQAGVAPHDGLTGGLRLTFLSNRTIQLGIGLFYGDLERLIQDPTQPADTRTTGPVSQRVIWTDASFTLNLTGNKSWRRLAPYAGAAGGLAFTEKLDQDESGFRMGTKFYLAPMAGTRIFLAQRLYLHLEARALFWQAKYPSSFFSPPSGGDPDPLVSSPAEWIVTPWLQAGLGWAVSWPF